MDTPQGERIARLEEQMELLMGDGQPGVIAKHEKRIQDMENAGLEVRAWIKSARWWLPIVGALLAFATGGGRLSLEKLLDHFGL